MRIQDEAAYFNSAPDNSSYSPSKGGRNRDGQPPMHKGAGGKGGDRGGGGSGAGGGASASGGGGGPSGYGGYSGAKNQPSEKGGSANAKGSDFASRPQQRAAAQAAMQDALSMMGNGMPFTKPITGMSDIIANPDKRSNSKRGKPISPGKVPSATNNGANLTVSKLG